MAWSPVQATGFVPEARDGHTACVIDDCMYIFGGYEEDQASFSEGVYKLDLKTFVWSFVQTMVNRHLCSQTTIQCLNSINSCNNSYNL